MDNFIKSYFRTFSLKKFIIKKIIYIFACEKKNKLIF